VGQLSAVCGFRLEAAGADDLGEEKGRSSERPAQEAGARPACNRLPVPLNPSAESLSSPYHSSLALAFSLASPRLASPRLCSPLRLLRNSLPRSERRASEG